MTRPTHKPAGTQSRKRTGAVTQRKRDPRELDRVLDRAIEDSMGASDPPTVSDTVVKINKTKART